MNALPDIRVLEHGEPARTALHPLRRRILTTLRDPGSASSVARELELPRQKVNYHLRLLERDGLVELVEERKAGNVKERVMRATAHAFVIAPEALGPLAPAPEDIRDRFSSAYLTAIAARTVQEVGDLARTADARGLRLQTLTVETEVRFSSPAEQAAFARDLTRAVTELVARYHDEDAEDGRTFRLFAGSHPKPAARPDAHDQSEPDGDPTP